MCAALSVPESPPRRASSRSARSPQRRATRPGVGSKATHPRSASSTSGQAPLTVKFTVLRELVEGLEGFAPEPGQSVNEQLLEAIQQAWIEEKEDADAEDDDDDDEEPGYSPNQPFR